MSQQEHLSALPGVAEQVQSFYDRYPYPPPVDNLDKYRSLWQDGQRRRADYHLSWPASPYKEDQSILIAGCGTSQAAKHALRWPEAQVTGIDSSATSVRSTEDLKRKYNLKNLQVHQLAIEQVSGLGMASIRSCAPESFTISPTRMLGSALCQRAQAGGSDASHGVRALRAGWHLYVAGVLPAARHPCHRCRHSRSHQCAQRAASRTSSRNAAPSCSGLPA